MSILLFSVSWLYELSYYSSVCSWCSLVVCLPCDDPVGTHTYVTRFCCSFMVDFMALVIMRSVWFLALSKLSRLHLAVMAYADQLYSRLGLTVHLQLVLSFCSSVPMLSQLLYTLSSAFVQPSPLMDNVWSRVPLVKRYWYNDCLPPYMQQCTE